MKVSLKTTNQPAYTCQLLLCFQFSGVNAARDAGLTFMVGGPENCFKSAEKFLSIMGKNVVHCGPVGTGQVVYQCENGNTCLLVLYLCVHQHVHIK